MNDMGLRMDRPDLCRVRFSNSDELASVLAYLGSELTRVDRSNGEGWYTDGSLADIRYHAITVAGRHHLRGHVPARCVLMQFDMGSNGQRRLGGHAVDGDDVLVGSPGAQFDMLTAEHHIGMTFGLPEALAMEALGYRAPGAESPAGGPLLHVLSNCGPWTARIRMLVGTLPSLNDHSAGPLVQRHAGAEISDLLVGMLLLPWNHRTAVTFRSPHYQRLPIVRRVIAFMHANLHEPLMLHDLCNAARASERAVEYAFRDVCGVSPKQYLKLLRLHEVRRELKTLPANAATVTDIAHRCGFWHLGHFSTAYRALFGETPRQSRRHRN